MNVRKLGNQDHATLKKFLEPFQGKALFLLNNMSVAGLDYTGQTYGGEYWACFNSSGKITSVLAHYWNGNIIVQSDHIDSLTQTFDYFLKERTRPIAGLLGPSQYISAIIDSLKLDHDAFTINAKEGLYVLDILKQFKKYLPDEPQNYSLKKAQDINQDLLIDWIKGFDIQALKKPDNKDTYRNAKRRAQNIVSDGFGFILTYSDVPVSLCNSNARFKDICRIGPVWTPPEHRGKKYARILLSKVINHLFQKYGIRTATLITENPAALNVYQSTGFQHIGKEQLSILKTPIPIKG